ncbi:MAG: UbiA family prenyltransferase [Acidobacteria bacterium]|nr:UbiA family prenyltransferase [Acidobacteriota bacterium]
MQQSGASGVPLCVDLDGTLVKSDTLLDSAMALWRKEPLSPLQWPTWVAGGKARLKRELTRRIELDVEHLPYNQPLLDYLKEEYAAGRRIFLATAADTGLATRIANYLGIFEGVLASDGTLNLAGANKLAAFEERFPDGFTYIGNAMPDRALLGRSVSPMVANPHWRLLRALRNDKVQPARHFLDRSHRLKAFIKAVRLHQWAKNILIFVPLCLAHMLTPNRIVAAITAFFSISFCASATYIINDLLDIEADRRHPRKNRRAFASGDLSPITGVAIIAVFLAIAIALAVALPYIYRSLPGVDGAKEILDPHYPFLLWLTVYTVSTLAYSIRLKRMMLVDVLVLSGLYTVRIVAGANATDVVVSPWLAAFSIFFFLSLAFVKRFSELYMMAERNIEKPSGRGYHVEDLEQIRSFGTAAGYAGVVVLTMYISTPDNVQLYRHATRLWLLAPVLLLWISRIWMTTSRGEMHEDPVVYAILDKRSWILGAMAAFVVWWAL